MSGKQVFNWREADRNEYLASFLLSALGMATPVPRQDDGEVDFHCSLADQEKGVVTFGFPFLVQVKSTAKPVVHIKPPKRYRHQKGVIPDHLSGLFRQDLPLFLALVDKEEFAIHLYSLAPIWFLHHDTKNCPDCSAVRLVPRLDGNESDPVGPPKRISQVTSSPESHEYEVDLGGPVASVTIDDTGKRATLMKKKNSLRICIDYGLRNLVFSRTGLPHFYWMAEAGGDNEEPTPAFFSAEAPRGVEDLKNIYSFLGPALLPLALRYKDDDRKDLLAALRDLFREMPADTVPAEVRKALPEVFPR